MSESGFGPGGGVGGDRDAAGGRGGTGGSRRPSRSVILFIAHIMGTGGAVGAGDARTGAIMRTVRNGDSRANTVRGAIAMFRLHGGCLVGIFFLRGR